MKLYTAIGFLFLSASKAAGYRRMVAKNEARYAALKGCSESVFVALFDDVHKTSSAYIEANGPAGQMAATEAGTWDDWAAEIKAG